MKIRITENDLHTIIRESVKTFLVEKRGIYSKELINLYKQHGGIARVEYDAPSLDRWDTTGVKFILLPDLYELEKQAKGNKDLLYLINKQRIDSYRFLQKIVTFKDGYGAYIMKPEYEDNPEVKAEIERVKQETEKIKNDRLGNFADGKQFYYPEEILYRNKEGELESRPGGPDYNSPRDATDYDRLKVHHSSRNKPNEVPRGSNADYKKYIQNQVEVLKAKYNMKQVDFTNSLSGLLTPEQIEQAKKDFRKIGYNQDDRYTWPQVENGVRKFAVCPNGRTYMEWDDPGFGPDGYIKGKEEPKIGTRQWFKRNN